MKKFLPLLLLLFSFLSGKAQKEFSIGDLVTYTSLPVNKFNTSMSRKGFKPQLYDTTNEAAVNLHTYARLSKDKSIEQIIGKYDRNETSEVLFQTSSAAEFNEMKEELKKEGFSVAGDNSNLLYQKANITIRPMVKQEGARTCYCFKIEKKALPKARDIMYAEDLLQLTSHEYIATVFGPSNVKKDNFYFSEKEISKCSVLFPNTSLQVIFIWNDEINNQDIAFVMIGGQVRSQSSMAYYKPVELNKWQSRQGIYSGMSLKDLSQLHGNSINFYGWETEQAGLVAKNNTKGNVNFKKIGLQLNCLDCNEDKYYSNNELISSGDMLKENRRVYVSSLVLLP